LVELGGIEPPARVWFPEPERATTCQPLEMQRPALVAGVLRQAAVSVFGIVPAGQNFLPLIRSGGGKIPASVQRSIVRTLTLFCSAILRVGFNALTGRSESSWDKTTTSAI
jgi:hypothetical protein